MLDLFLAVLAVAGSAGVIAAVVTLLWADYGN